MALDYDTLLLLKRHLRIDDMEDETEDRYVAGLYAAAEGAVVGATNRTEAELRAIGGGEYPADLQHAIFMEVGHLYDQREGASSVNMLTDPYLLTVVKKYEKLSDREA